MNLIALWALCLCNSNEGKIYWIISNSKCHRIYALQCWTESIIYVECFSNSSCAKIYATVDALLNNAWNWIFVTMVTACIYWVDPNRYSSLCWHDVELNIYSKGIFSNKCMCVCIDKRGHTFDSTWMLEMTTQMFSYWNYISMNLITNSFSQQMLKLYKCSS